MDFQALWAKELVAGNTVGHVVGFMAAFAATLVAAKAMQLLFRGALARLAQRSKTRLDDIVLQTFERPIYWITTVVGFDLALEALALPARVLEFAGNVVTVVVTMLLVWSASNLVSALRAAYVDPWVAQSESRLDDHIVPIFERVLKVGVWVTGALLVVANLGYDIMSLLTGLGLGGLAVAMAAKDTVSNVFGSVTILADRPFQVGDVVTMAGHTGTVEEVGLRTCRLRTFEGTLVTVPNGSLVGGVVENLSVRKARRFLGTLGLTYATSADELEAAIAATRAILEAHPKVRSDFSVRFMNFGPSSLDLQVLYWVEPAGEYADVVAEINLAIKKKYDAEGWCFALPSMTVYRGEAAPVEAAARLN